MSAGDKQKEFDELLGRHVRRVVKESEGGACPDANLLAAYREHALSAEEAALCTDHFAGCARCREILAALEASEGIPAEEPAPLAAPAHGPEESKKGGRPLWWMAPAGVLAAAMILWIATREEKGAIKTERAEVKIAENRPQAAPVPAPVVPAEKRAAGTLDVTRAPAKAEPRAKSLEKESGVAGYASGNAVAPVPEARGAVSSLAAAAPTAPPAREEGKLAAATTENAAGLQKSGAARAAAVRESEARKDEAGEIAAAPEKSKVPSMTVISAPGGRVQWRVGALGRIEGSTDGGRNWAPQTSGVNADLLVGAAPSEQVCWVAGRQGTILLSTDGSNWRRIPAPASVDFLGITASDARRATLRDAGDGQRYSTEDGGDHWARAPKE